MSVVIRPVNTASDAEIQLVAERMRLTLVEVLGESTGGAMYTMDWLIQRVRFHLDSAQCTGQVLVSQAADGAIDGHTIVRIEPTEDIGTIGLFSTIYVDPAARGRGVAKALIAHGEAWMIEHSMPMAATYTASTNTRLHRLFESLGYGIQFPKEGWAILSKPLAG